LRLTIKVQWEANLAKGNRIIPNLQILWNCHLPGH
jgi:hypothetical protein